MTEGKLALGTWYVHDGSSAPPPGVHHADEVRANFGNENDLFAAAGVVQWARVVRWMLQRRHPVADQSFPMGEAVTIKNAGTGHGKADDLPFGAQGEAVNAFLEAPPIAGDRWPEGLHDGRGRKDDAGKDRFDLLPGDALKAIATILTFGAKKYAPRNWEAGMDWSRVYGALQRHLWAWWQGEAKDAETGYSHLWHAGTCLLFLIAYEQRGTGTDDRPKV